LTSTFRAIIIKIQFKVILWGEAQLLTGSKVCEERKSVPERVQFPYRRYSPDDKRILKAVCNRFIRPELFGAFFKTKNNFKNNFLRGFLNGRTKRTFRRNCGADR
jgi:hypothetical protein